MTIHPETIGIDVAKRHLDVFDPHLGTVCRVPNTPAEAARLATAWSQRPCLVVFEATGHYDAALRHALAKAGIAHARVNPEQARDFAKATGRRAKTDAIDARMLAEFGARLAPSPREAVDPDRERLGTWNKRRDQLVGMRQQERTRKSECDDASLLADFDRHLAWLDKAIADLDAAIDELMCNSTPLQSTGKLLRSVPGVGPVTAAILLGLMPELGLRSPKVIAALGGLAPYNNDSGRFNGKRSVHGGRKRVRDALYMAAVSASRTKTPLGAFYRKLRDAGKPPKLAFIALARKILVILNAVARDKTEFKTS